MFLLKLMHSNSNAINLCQESISIWNVHSNLVWVGLGFFLTNGFHKVYNLFHCFGNLNNFHYIWKMYYKSACRNYESNTSLLLSDEWDSKYQISNSIFTSKLEIQTLKSFCYIYISNPFFPMFIINIVVFYKYISLNYKSKPLPLYVRFHCY